jgi:hypothetical protein
MKPTRGTDKVSPAIALALLHALRTSDTPPEVIEDESFRISLPRRLGLNEVIDTQMRRFAEIRDRRGTISTDEFASLLGLIDRRPDDIEIFAAAGRALAEGRFPPHGSVDRARARLTPRRLRRRKLILGMREVARALEPGARIAPVPDSGIDGIEVRDPPLAATTDGGSGCSLLTGALEICAARLADGEVRVRHADCVARGDETCRWVVEKAEAGLTS